MSFDFASAEALGIGLRPVRDEEDTPFLAFLYASTRLEEVAQTGWPAEAQVQFLLSQFELQSQHYAKFRPNAERMVIDLGRPSDTSRFLFLGHHEKLPTQQAVIV